MGLFSFGSNRSEQSASAQAQNFNISANTLFGPQAQAFAGLFPQASQLAGQQLGQIGPAAQGLSSGLGQQGQGFLGQLGGGGFDPSSLFNFAGGLGSVSGANSPFLASGFESLQNLASGQSATQQQLGQTQGNPFLDQAISNIGQDITQQLGRQNQAIGQDFTLSGTRGGSRQGVQQGLAGEAAIDAFTQQSGAIRAQDAAQQQQLQQQGLLANLQSQLGAAQGLTGNALQQQLGQGQLGLGASGQQLQALQAAGGLQNQQQQISNQGAGIGLGSLGGLFNLGLGGFGAQFSPLESLAGILGGGLNQSFGFGAGSSSSQSSGSGSGFNFGVGEL